MLVTSRNCASVISCDPGNITASAVYSAVCLYATSVSNQWAADGTTGSWTVN